MALQRIGLRTSGLTIANACWGLLAPSTVRTAVIELGIIQSAAAAQSLGLGRPAATGTSSGNTLLQTDDPNDPATVSNATLTWSAQPTAPTIFHQRWNSAATIGVGILWTFARGLLVAASGQLVVWNITAAQASDINVACDA